MSLQGFDTIGFHRRDRRLPDSSTLWHNDYPAEFYALQIGIQREDEIAGELGIRVDRQVDDIDALELTLMFFQTVQRDVIAGVAVPIYFAKIR